MLRQSEDEIIATIEGEVLDDCPPSERYDRLLAHCGELADRWIGFATLGTASPKALINNDGFLALRACLGMALDAGSNDKSKEHLDHLREMLARLTKLCVEPDGDDMKYCVSALRNLFALPD